MVKTMVILLWCRKVITDLLAIALQKRPDVQTIGVHTYDDAKSAATERNPSIALIELHEKQNGLNKETLGFCDEIRKASPGCKIVLLCPEADKESVQVCIEAKRQGQIEDFVFYDTSTDYLVSKLESLFI